VAVYTDFFRTDNGKRPAEIVVTLGCRLGGLRGGIPDPDKGGGIDGDTQDGREPSGYASGLIVTPLPLTDSMDGDGYNQFGVANGMTGSL
jgi:hypothetical protein